MAAKITNNIQLNQETLDSWNVEQAREDNKKSFDSFGGMSKFVSVLEINPTKGLTATQVDSLRHQFGSNEFPESPMKSYLALFITALSDPVLMLLLAASAVSLVVGTFEHPDKGWIEGAAIFIAVFLVANIAASNDNSKELQFRALEASSQKDERTSVLRDGFIERVNPKDLVVGDIIVLQVLCNIILIGIHLSLIVRVLLLWALLL